MDTESTAPPAVSTVWRTPDSMLLGSEPVPTIAIRCPLNSPCTSIGSELEMILSRWLSCPCAWLAELRALITS